MTIICWDYDGTLVNTEIIYKHALESFFITNNYLNKDITKEYFYKNIAGKHPEEFLEKITAEGYIKPNLIIDPMDIKKYYSYYFSQLKQGEIKITNNIDNVVDELSKKNDTFMCITSSSYTHDFQIKYKNVQNEILNKNFILDKNVYLCGAINGCNFKPAPDIFIYAFNDIIQKNLLNINYKDKLFIIEDSAAGCQAGNKFKQIVKNKINVTIVGYLGATIIDNTVLLLNNGADIVVKNSEDLLNFLNRNIN